MAGSQQFAVGGTAVPLVAAPVSAYPGPAGWFYIANGGTVTILVGGPGVTSSTGAQVAAGGTVSGWLFGGDQVWAVTAAGSASPVYALQTGA